MATKQDISRRYDTPWEKARIYLKIMLPLGNAQITRQELDILAFIACTGDISKVPIRRACLEKFSISNSSLNNSISKLKRQGLLVKTKGQNINIHPNLQVDFTSDLYLNIKLGSKGHTDTESGSQE